MKTRYNEIYWNIVHSEELTKEERREKLKELEIDSASVAETKLDKENLKN